jgi:predicted anti-sigma-YlaC factor YlaD
VNIGNFFPVRNDYLPVMCDDVRFALSARLDGEEPGQPAGEIEAHLATCLSCASWQREAARLTQVVRAQPARVPDLTDSIMAAAAADADERARSTRTGHSAAGRGGARDPEAYARRQVLRVAVAAAAVIQLALALPALVDPAGAAAGIHATREMASFDLAVAVGFLLAAYRPARARAYMPVAMVLALCLAVTSGVDVARGVAAASHEIGHLVAVVQAALLFGLGRADRAGRPGTRAPAGQVTT